MQHQDRFGLHVEHELHFQSKDWHMVQSLDQPVVTGCHDHAIHHALCDGTAGKPKKHLLSSLIMQWKHGPGQTHSGQIAWYRHCQRKPSFWLWPCWSYLHLKQTILFLVLHPLTASSALRFGDAQWAWLTISIHPIHTFLPLLPFAIELLPRFSLSLPLPVCVSSSTRVTDFRVTGLVR